MHKKGFRKGPLGYLLQEPTKEARLIKDDPSLQDKSATKKEDLVLLWSIREGVTSLTKEKSLVNTLCFLYNGATCVPGTRMYKLQHYLWSQMQSDRPSQRTKSRYGNDGISVHFFHQQGPVRYIYCSTKVFKAHHAEGLTNPRLLFQDFMGT
ncbi:hypothetical protein KOW79_015437 [Hemibagrus wyckioides]|uniref:Uncharacterized protein n=1 Tax=Hemibagrus wyckioides TaxID=337641 RepID=A0A9D3SEA9_9TELE|nr:hypothetical protein KOW79_015437 [Hemibagrus wyckioides]